MKTKFFIIFFHLVFLCAWERVSSLDPIEAESLYIEARGISIDKNLWKDSVKIREHEEKANTYILIAQDGDDEVEIEFQVEFIYSLIEKTVVMYIFDPDHILHVTFRESFDAYVFYRASYTVKEDTNLLSMVPEVRHLFNIIKLSRVDTKTFKILDEILIEPLATLVIEKLSEPYFGENYRILIKRTNTHGSPYLVCYPSSSVFVNLINNNDMLLAIYEQQTPIKKHFYFFRFVSEKDNFINIIGNTLANDNSEVLQSFTVFSTKNS